MAGPPIQDPLNISPPVDLSDRPLYLTANGLSTMRLMHDPFDPNTGKWFDLSIAKAFGGNEAKFLIRGNETYADMVADIRAAATMPASGTNRPFIYLLAWFFNLGDAFQTSPVMTMIPGDPNSQPRKVFEQAAAKGVEVRAMLWSQRQLRFRDTGALFQGKFLNSLPGARCIVDDKTGVLATIPLPGLVAPNQLLQRKGAHHQKVLIVNGPGGLIAYCGGLDINRDRVDTESGGFGPGFQDVHVRIRGPAAADLLLLFRQRWDDYLFGSDPDIGHDDNQPKAAFPGENLNLRDLLSGGSLSRPGPVDQAPHRQFIQIARTFHRGLYNRIHSPDGSFDPVNPLGEKNIRKMIFKGIDTAEDFIYMEDQYLFDPSVSSGLLGAIAKPDFRHLIIMIPDDNSVNGELFDQPSLRRAQFLNPLLQGPNGKKVHVFSHNRFTHSKIYIFDDKYAIIGSANCNRRGLSHDSEVDAGIFDRSSDEEPALHFARRLRMRLWATHLNLQGNVADPNVPVNTDDEFSELADGVASVVHWLKPPPKARIRPYLVNNTTSQALALRGLGRAIGEFGKESATNHNVLSTLEEAAVKAALAPVAAFAFIGTQSFWDTILDPSDG
jgi:phosphatidylserine/phosphatidylglycerophosphate/cardiolipin synthase-like enzyme